MNSKEYLTKKVASIKTEGLEACCRKLLNDERFWISPAAAQKHQAWEGGLAEHTAQVMDIALSMANCDSLKKEMHHNHDYSCEIIIAGTLWHDYGKIWDYKKAVSFEDFKEIAFGMTHVYKRHRWTIRHLSRSYAEFFIAALSTNVSEQTMEEIAHCILAHHGRSEWGSPVEPLSPEASIIHYADCMSAFHIGKPHIFQLGRTNWKTAKDE